MKFKVGDRVRFNTPDYLEIHNIVAIIKSVNDGYYTLEVPSKPKNSLEWYSSDNDLLSANSYIIKERLGIE